MKNGLVVYYCKRISEENDDIEVFAKPVPYTLRLGFLTVQPASGYNDVVEFGDNIGKTWTAYGQPYEKWFGMLKEGDRFYVDGAVPNGLAEDVKPDDGWGYDANARIYSVRPQNRAVKFILQKIE